MLNTNHSSSIRRSIGFAASVIMSVSLLCLSVAHAAQSVIVTNPVTIANPVHSVTVNNPDPSKQAFTENFGQITNSYFINQSFGTVPAGKRLVIENESLSCLVYPAGAPILYAYLSTSLGTTYLLLQKMSGDSDGDYYAGTFTSKMYGDSRGLGAGVDFQFYLQSTLALSHIECNGTIIGHTVASPFH